MYRNDLIFSMRRDKIRIEPRPILGGLLLLLLVFLCGSAHAETDITKSPSDPREYQLLELPNGLRALLISDPATDKAAAALSVAVGSGDDPQHRPGLAHFLEHMLFLGTAKYPEPDAYQTFISARGGSHNAYTAFDHTNYFFDIDKDHLEPALDRFAQFFIAPLFSADYVDRERRIVDSEYQSKRRDDTWRGRHAFKQVINPAHPLARFSVGSLDTLADRGESSIRDELMDFYRQRYSANLMTLAVLGREPLPTLRRWATEKFGPIVNNNVPRSAPKVPLFAPGSLPLRLEVAPVKDERTLTLTYPLPSMEEHYREKPLFYLANLLGHEGAGSLLSLLKLKGWSTGLSAGHNAAVGEEATFYLSVQLTEAGLDNIDEIVGHVFEYIRMIRAQGVRPRLFDEQRRLTEIGFQFMEKAPPLSYVRALAARLTDYEPADVLSGPFLMERYDPELIRSALERLTPDNMLITVTARGLPTDLTAPWFDTPYRIGPVTPAQRDDWQTRPIDSRLALPEPNIFLPEDLAHKPLETVIGKPRRIRQDAKLALWHQQDDTYKVPRADFYFNVRSPVANSTPKHAMLTQLYVGLINDQLTEFAYPAQLAGLSYNLYTHMRGFSVRISGYSDKQEPLLAQLAKTLRRPTIDPKRFGYYKDRLRRQLRNALEERPSTQALGELQTLLLTPSWPDETLLGALEPLKAEDLERFVPELFRNVRTVALSHGNIRREEALQRAELLETALLSDADPVDVPRGRVVKLAGGQHAVRQLSSAHEDSAVVVYYQGDDRRFETRARFGLLGQMLSGPFFHELRTQQQLGYVVFASAMPMLEVPGLVFTVQSPSTDPVELSRRVEQFISSYRDRIETMTEAAFEEYKRGLLTKIMEREKTLQERSDRYWKELDSEQLEFDSRERLAAAVRGISRQDLLTLYDQALLGPARKQMTVQAFGARHKPPAEGRESIVDAQSFKRGKPYFSG